MHNLMKRQLKKFLGGGSLEGLSPEYQNFIEAVNKVYCAFDEDRAMLERSLDISSEELLQANSQMRAMLEAFPDLFFVTEGDGKILQYNTHDPEALYLPPAEFLGKKMPDVLPADVGELFRTAFQDLRGAPHKLMKIEYWMEVTKGRLCFEARLLSFLENQVFIIIRDVTDRKRAEEELITYTRRLEQSNNDLMDFAHVASHDLQEPLRKIQTFADRLREKCREGLGETGSDYLYRMQSAAERMQILISDLLAYARVTTRTEPFHRVDLNEILKQVIPDLEIRIEKTSGRVIVDPLIAIEADPIQMRQLFQNLLGNALKFHRVNVPPCVRVYAMDSGDPEFCQIVVEDNGIGFDEKHADHIFAIFQRLHGRTEYEGTGVGLSICRKIVTRHNGTIFGKSRPGEGTQFMVRLPYKQDRERNDL